MHHTDIRGVGCDFINGAFKLQGHILASLKCPELEVTLSDKARTYLRNLRCPRQRFPRLCKRLIEGRVLRVGFVAVRYAERHWLLEVLMDPLNLDLRVLAFRQSARTSLRHRTTLIRRKGSEDKEDSQAEPAELPVSGPQADILRFKPYVKARSPELLKAQSEPGLSTPPDTHSSSQVKDMEGCRRTSVQKSGTR